MSESFSINWVPFTLISATSMTIKKRELSDSSWCEKLGDDPWECILRKLPFPDVLRFKRVRRSWSSMVENYVSSPCYRPCFQTPWLLLPSGEDEGRAFGSLSFFNLDERKEYRDVCVCGEVERGRCVGSSHGCFILLDKKANLSIFNPFSDGGRIPMGSLESTHVNSDTVRNMPRSVVHKAAMICNNKNRDIHGSGVVLVLIYGTERNLAFHRYCDDGAGAAERKKFIKLPGARPPYDDVVCNTETNRVSAISDTGSVQVWDLNFSTGSSFPPRKIMDVAPPIPASKIAVSEIDLYSYHYYLVESCGELLFILRSVGDYVNMGGDGKPVRYPELLEDNNPQPTVCPYQTLMFNVYRLDRNENWVEIQSLGDRVVFIGGSESFSMRAEDCPGCRKDSIYFTDSYWDRMDEDHLYGGHDMGCYSLRDQSFNSFYDQGVCQMKPVPFWFLPNPSPFFLEHH